MKKRASLSWPAMVSVSLSAICLSGWLPLPSRYSVKEGSISGAYDLTWAPEIDEVGCSYVVPFSENA